MSLIPTGDEKRFEEQRDVVELYVQNINPTAIAKQLGIRRVDVLNHIDEWKSSAVGLDVMKDRVEELITSMDEHYSILIKKFYEIVAEVDDSYADADKGKAAMLAQKGAALRAIGDLEGKRIDILQKSGLLEAADLGDELAEMEENKRILMQILEEEMGPECKKRVMRRLREQASGFGGDVVVVSGD